MPFRSEKQRRYLWATHPELAKKWAKDYPESNKNLPMYAKVNSEDETMKKADVFAVLRAAIGNNLTNAQNQVYTSESILGTKLANSKMEHIVMPTGHEPYSAGEKQIEKQPKPGAEDEGSIGQSRTENATVNPPSMQETPLVNKLAAVLAPRIQQMIEDERARQAARESVRVPQNVNVKRYAMPSANIPPPIGMAQAPAPAQPAAPQQAQPPQPQQNGLPSVNGKGGSPQSNPINSFGALSMSGEFNGNASLGTANAPGAKMAAQKCSCGCGQKVNECTCPPSCSCRQKNGSCYGLKKQAGNNDVLTWLMSLDNCNVPDPEDLDYDERMKRAGSRALDIALLGLPLATGALGATWGSRMGENKWIHNGENASDPGGFNHKFVGGTYGALAAGGLGLIPALMHKYEVRNGKIYPQKDYLKRWSGDERMKSGTTKRAGLSASELTRMALPLAIGGVGGGLAGSYGPLLTGNKPSLTTSLGGTLGGTAAGALYAYYDLVNRSKKERDALRAKKDTTSQDERNLAELETHYPDKQPAEIVDHASDAAMFNEMFKNKQRSALVLSKRAASSPAWQRSAGKNDEGGLNAKGRASYNNATGGNLKAPVTESNPTGERDKRQNSFCSRMCGMKRVNTGSKTKKDPDSRINKSLRKWNCKCSAATLLKASLATYSQKQAGASMGRILGTALASTGGGLLLGGYPGWKLQTASENAGNHEFVNFIAGKAPIALAGALTAGIYNNLHDQYVEPPKKEPKPEPESVAKYLQYLVH